MHVIARSHRSVFSSLYTNIFIALKMPGMQARETGAERYLEERQFEDFAIQILALLQQYRNVYAEYLARSTADEWVTHEHEKRATSL